MRLCVLALLSLGLATACGGGGGSLVGVAPIEPPKALMSWSQIENSLVGTFNIPQSEEAGTDFRFGYSNAVHGQLANGNLLVMGHPWFPMQAEVQLPGALNGSEATRVSSWFDLTDGLEPLGWQDGPAYELGGLLEIDTRIYFTKHQWYNAPGDNWATQGFREAGVANGMWGVEGAHAHHSRVGGYMSAVPTPLLAEGYTYLAGLEGTSGAALGRWGPNLFAIRVDETLDVGDAFESRPLVSHNLEENAPAGWWIGDKVSSAVWLETDTQQAVLFFLYQKLGATWYGEADEGPDGAVDPYGGGKGYHAEGYALKVWMYDPAELLEVYRGEREPWSVEPMQEIVLTERLPGAVSETHNGWHLGSAKDELKVSYRDGRLIVLQPNGYEQGLEACPKGYVFQLDR
ncbi:MAG: hypothetical protein QNJ98_02510 [Planctomycetota bacterium]|nr:hypothetical protein [Planctomycetota bacterium]